jgi:hypothetical protein
MGFLSRSKKSDKAPAAAAAAGPSSRPGDSKSADELLDMYGEFMIEHSSMLNEAGVSGNGARDGAADDEDEYVFVEHDSRPASPGSVMDVDPFADDHVENTRATDGKDFHLYSMIPNRAVRRGGGAMVDPVAEFRREVAGLGIDIVPTDLDVLFDAEEELEHTSEERVPVVEMDLAGVAEQFRDLALGRGGEPEEEAAFAEFGAGMSRVGRNSSTAGTAVLADSDSGYASFEGRETDPTMLNAADVEMWDESTREFICDIFASDDMLAGMDSLVIVSSTEPKQTLSVDTFVENPTREGSQLLARRYRKWAAMVGTPALHRDDEDEFLSFDDLETPALHRYDEEDFLLFDHIELPPAWLDDMSDEEDIDLTYLDGERKKKIDDHKKKLDECPLFREADIADPGRYAGHCDMTDVDHLMSAEEEQKAFTVKPTDVDHLMSAEEEQRAFTVKRAKGRDIRPVDITDARSGAFAKHAEQCPRATEKDTKARNGPQSADIADMKIPITDGVNVDGHDQPRPSVSYFDANEQRQTPYMALSELYYFLDEKE